MLVVSAVLETWGCLFVWFVGLLCFIGFVVVYLLVCLYVATCRVAHQYPVLDCRPFYGQGPEPGVQGGAAVGV